MLTNQEFSPTCRELTGVGPRVPSHRKGIGIWHKVALGHNDASTKFPKHWFQSDTWHYTPRTHTKAHEMIIDLWGRDPMVYLLHVTTHKKGKRMRLPLTRLNITSTVVTRAMAHIPHTIQIANKNLYMVLNSVHYNKILTLKHNMWLVKFKKNSIQS